MLDAFADPKSEKERVRSELRQIAGEILSELSTLESSEGKEILSDFVSELFLGVAKQNQREERRQKQAEGIAAARAKGVRFGRTRKPVPDNFDALHRAWRDGEMSLQKAADMCGLSRGTFYSIALRKEEAGDRVG